MVSGLEDELALRLRAAEAEGDRGAPGAAPAERARGDELTGPGLQ